jgi:hypothetical protein
MKMRQVDAIDLPAGQTVELKPGGYHLMLMGLKAPLKDGDKRSADAEVREGRRRGGGDGERREPQAERSMRRAQALISGTSRQRMRCQPSDFSASLMPSLTLTSWRQAFSAAAASRSL